MGPMRVVVSLTMGTLALALSGRLSIPMVPVPMTLQSLVVLLIGAFCIPAVAGSTIALYLFFGAIGLPVFANGTSGTQVLLGPAGGFLWSFLLVAMTVSFAVEDGFTRTTRSRLSVFLVAHMVMLLIGAAWLAAYIGIAGALRHGFLPFLPGALLKSALAAVMARVHVR